MTEGLEAITSAALALALDAASMRQQACATNIANASTEGFVPLRVSFESQLEDARATLRAHGSIEPSSLEGVEPALQQASAGARGLSPKVQLDVEVAAMSQNAAQYQTLLKALSKHYALLAAAVSDGKK